MPAHYDRDPLAATQRLLNRGARLTELLKQAQYQPMQMAEQVCVVFAGVHGYLDAVKVADVTRFDREFLAELRANGQDLLEDIQSTGQLSEESEKKLRAMLDRFSKSFA
jgi:F-type H+-transporting ATPase subunit alpha